MECAVPRRPNISLVGHHQKLGATGPETSARKDDAQKQTVSYTIGYFTTRREPHFEWFMEALASQSPDLDKTQLVLVDYWLAPGRPHYPLAHRKAIMAAIVNQRCEFLHLAPKPTPWQGECRQTREDWFAASNARNTALIVAKGKTFVAVDDLSVPKPGWWDQVRHSAVHGYLAMGAYRKMREMVVENGRVISHRDDGKGHDSRWGTGHDGGISPAPGSNLYGCAFALPLKTAIEVDGFCEGCDAQGAEDYDFGMRVERTGCKCFYNRNFLTYESTEGHEDEPSFRREKVRIPNHVLPEPLRGSFPNGLDSDHAAIKSLLATNRTQPLIPSHIKEARELWSTTGKFKEPDCGLYDWRTGALIAST